MDSVLILNADFWSINWKSGIVLVLKGFVTSSPFDTWTFLLLRVERYREIRIIYFLLLSKYELE